MRYPLAAILVLCASAASAGGLDFLGGIPDAPGVVHGGSFGLTGNDYYGVPQRNGISHEERAVRHAKVRPPRSMSDKRLPKS